MNYTYGLSDKIIAYLTLISGLVVSAVAVWYSVAGLVSIFAASAFAIIVMGVALETSKLVATIWLKWNWYRAPRLIKIYLISAIAILMLITSMGIFGYLSKAHLDQNIVSGDVQSKIALFDEKIKIERENIANAQQVIKQMDAAVNGVIATGDQEVKARDGTTRIRSAAERSLQIRRSQAKDRQDLTKQIEVSQTKIVQLQEESSPIRAEMRQVEAEVGPIKYIAKLIYADDPDQNLLEKAVTWVIIIIVLVFDPLAVVLLLASQYSFQWFRQQDEERKNELVQTGTTPQATGDSPVSNPEPQDRAVDEGSGEQSSPDPELPQGDDAAEEANRKIAEIEQPKVKYQVLDDADDEIVELEILQESPKEKDTLTEWNHMVDQERELEDDQILAQAAPTEKHAMHVWKAENPDGCLKHQRKLLDRGVITELPWNKYLAPQPDFVEPAAVEAKKWADENPNTPAAATAVEWAQEQDGIRDVTWMEHDDQGNQIKRIKENYQQNAEQNERTIWQRIQDLKK